MIFLMGNGPIPFLLTYKPSGSTIFESSQPLENDPIPPTCCNWRLRYVRTFGSGLDEQLDETRRLKTYGGGRWDEMVLVSS